MGDVVLWYVSESIAAAIDSSTVDQWFFQWRDTYKPPPAW